MSDGRALAQAYDGGMRPSELIAATLAAIEVDDPVWISRVPQRLSSRGRKAWTDAPLQSAPRYLSTAGLSR